MHKIFFVSMILLTCALSAELQNAGTSIVFEKEFDTNSLGRIGDFPYPNNPLYDRAKGYLLKGKVQNAVSNTGNFITWDQHPAGFWGETTKFGYLPHIGFVAGVPGHDYSSQFTWEIDPAIEGLWFSTDAYVSWTQDELGVVNPENKPKEMPKLCI